MNVDFEDGQIYLDLFLIYMRDDVPVLFVLFN